MMCWVWLVALLGGCILGQVCGIRFGNTYGSHMVLQRAPQRAMLYGYADVIGDVVTIFKSGAKVGTAHVQHSSENGTIGYWDVLLPAESHHGPFVITASSKDGNITLSDVMFGDVWICSGQSNMQFRMNQANDSGHEILGALAYTDVRIMMSRDVLSATERQEVTAQIPWMKPRKGIIDYFSAVCFMYGRNLEQHLKYPIGLIEASWGGTQIQPWSSPEALAVCNHHGKKRALSSKTPSALWNAMIHPLIKTTIKGAIWYQEPLLSGTSLKKTLYVQTVWRAVSQLSNSATKAPLSLPVHKCRNRPCTVFNQIQNSESNGPNGYDCMFQSMIHDWRMKFNTATKGQTSGNFPFGFVQLGTFKNLTNGFGFVGTRWAQTANYGYAPNPKMNNTFMAVALDLPDFASPFGAVHPRFKEDVATRLTLGARAVAYQEKGIVYQGPFPTGFHLDNHHHHLNITFDQGTAHLIFHNTTGFEICCSTHKASNKCSYWKYTPVVATDRSMISLSTVCNHAGNHMAGVRYLWRISPCAFKMCPLYGSTNYLPVPPFIKEGGFTTTGGAIIG